MAGTLKNTLDTVGDAVAGTMGKMNAAMVADADTFVENLAISNQYEVEAANIALARSRPGPVKMFAQKMVADHTTAKHHLEVALMMNETKGVAAPPKALDSRRETMLKHLREAPDGAFESTYLDQQVTAHEEASTLLKTYAEGGDNPQLRSVALGSLPVVERHLAHAKALKH